MAATDLAIWLIFSRGHHTVDSSTELVFREITLVHRMIGAGLGCIAVSQFTQALWRKTVLLLQNDIERIYSLEISTLLRTMDCARRDVQFAISETAKMAVVFWYPVDVNPWHGSGHYSINCNWVPLDTSFGGPSLTKAASTLSWDVASAFSLLFSVISPCLSGFVM